MILIDTGELVARFVKKCNTGCGDNPRSDVQACITYLRNLGTRRCGVPHDNIVFCTAGQATISGFNLHPLTEASSYCSDVAIGAQNIVNSCTKSNGRVAGSDAANGNGDLIVSIGKLCT